MNKVNIPFYSIIISIFDESSFIAPRGPMKLSILHPRRVLHFLSPEILEDSQRKRRLALEKSQAALKNQFLFLRVLAPTTCLQVNINFRVAYGFLQTCVVNGGEKNTSKFNKE